MSAPFLGATNVLHDVVERGNCPGMESGGKCPTPVSLFDCDVSRVTKRAPALSILRHTPFSLIFPSKQDGRRRKLDEERIERPTCSRAPALPPGVHRADARRATAAAARRLRAGDGRVPRRKDVLAADRPRAARPEFGEGRLRRRAVHAGALRRRWRRGAVHRRGSLGQARQGQHT